MPPPRHTATEPSPAGDVPNREHEPAPGERVEYESVGGQLARWLSGNGEKTLGSLIERFGRKSFAMVFVLLLGVSALPLPTGGATHVFESIAVVLAFQLVADRDEIWLPRRWRELQLAGQKQQRFISVLMKMIRRLERISRPRTAALVLAPVAR